MPQIQFMPQINQVRELYIQAMKCGEAGERMDFIYFFEEWPERTYLDVVHGMVQAMTLFSPQNTIQKFSG